MIQFCSTSAAAGVGGPGMPDDARGLVEVLEQLELRVLADDRHRLLAELQQDRLVVPLARLHGVQVGARSTRSSSALAAAWFLDQFMMPQTSTETEAKRPFGPAGVFEM